MNIPTMDEIIERNAFIRQKYGDNPSSVDFNKGCYEWNAQKLGKAMESDEEKRMLADSILRHS